MTDTESVLEKKYGRRKSFDIEYVDVTEENLQDAAEWCKGKIVEDGQKHAVEIVDKNAINSRQKQAFPGDVIVHHLDLDTYKAFSKKAFDKSYEESAPGITDEQSKATVESMPAVRHLARDAATGEIVTQAYADENPSTTVVETFEVEQDATDGVDPKTLGNTELPRDADLS